MAYINDGGGSVAWDGIINQPTYRQDFVWPRSKAMVLITLREYDTKSIYRPKNILGQARRSVNNVFLQGVWNNGVFHEVPLDFATQWVVFPPHVMAALELFYQFTPAGNTSVAPKLRVICPRETDLNITWAALGFTGLN